MTPLSDPFASNTQVVVAVRTGEVDVVTDAEIRSINEQFYVLDSHGIRTWVAVLMVDEGPVVEWN